MGGTFFLFFKVLQLLETSTVNRFIMGNLKKMTFRKGEKVVDLINVSFMIIS